MLRENKAALIELINAGEYYSGKADDVEVPAQAIVPGCERITPDMLPLIELDQAAIETIVARVPGGVRNVQDIYPLAPLQEGILYHHIAAEQGDPYVLQAQFTIASRERFDEFTTALQQVIDRHDILRTSIIWEGLAEPVQVVWRKADLVLSEITIDPAAGPASEQLQQRFDPRHYRLDISQAPLLRLAFTHDVVNQCWVAMLLFHHIAIDHAALELVQQEIHAHLYGQAHTLGEPVPYRNYVAQARLGVTNKQHEGFSARCSATSMNRRYRSACTMCGRRPWRRRSTPDFAHRAEPAFADSGPAARGECGEPASSCLGTGARAP